VALLGLGGGAQPERGGGAGGGGGAGAARQGGQFHRAGGHTAEVAAGDAGDGECVFSAVLYEDGDGG